MSEKLKKCEVCNDNFRWDDDVVIVDDCLYHKDCVELYPMGYFAMLNGDPLGESENDEGQMAIEILEEGEYEEEDPNV